MEPRVQVRSGGLGTRDGAAVSGRVAGCLAVAAEAPGASPPAVTSPAQRLPGCESHLQELSGIC